MKHYSLKVLLWSIFLIVLKFVPKLDLAIEQTYYIYSAAFIVSALLSCAIPKRFVGTALALIITVITSVFYNDYFLYALPVLALISANKELNRVSRESAPVTEEPKGKKKKNEAVPFSKRLSYLCCGAAAICSAVQCFSWEEPGFGYEINDTLADLRFVGCYIVFIIALLVTVIMTRVGKKATAVEEDLRLQYGVFYFLSLVCLGVSIASSYLIDEQRRIADFVQLNYWFVFVVAIVINKDYYLNVLTKGFESFVSKARNKK